MQNRSRINKRLLTSVVSAATALIVFLTYSLHGNTQAQSLAVNTEVYFSPRGGATQAIIRELDHAKKEVKVLAYSFTHKDIAQALVNAKRRGINVEVVLDKSNKTAKYSAADFVSHMDITTYIDAQHAIAHNKIMIIDSEVVITGSFNFTKAAEEKNAENLLILRSKELATVYLQNWQEHKNHSENYIAK